ncbi:MAG: type II secretion system F family protein [Haloquadratum sp.]
MAVGEVVGFLPLVLATLVALPVALTPVSRRANLIVTRLSLPLFGRYVAESSARRKQVERMRAAFVGESHRVYAAQTLFISAVGGVVGSVYGVYLGALVLRSLAVDPAAIRSVLPDPLDFLAAIVHIQDLSVPQLFAVLLVASATIGTAFALGLYWGRWTYLDQRARARGIEIDATLPRTVAFVYALSRSGMPFHGVLRTLSHNEGVYGEAARELGVAVRDMDTFGTDILTALQGTADRTPSENLEELTANLVSVLSSGQSISEFLRDQYDRFQEEAKAQQQQYLELLSTFAEVYVTVLVAGPLFFITVLVVVGLVLQSTLTLIRLVTYVAIPLATFGFVVYVDSMTEGLTVPGRSTGDKSGDRSGDSAAGDGDAGGDADRPTTTQPSNGVGSTGGGAGDEVGAVETGVPADGGDVTGVTDGGAAAEPTTGGHRRQRSDAGDPRRENWSRLAVYDRIGAYRQMLADPVETLLREPAYTVAVTGPIGMLLIWLSSGAETRAALDGFARGAADPTAALLRLVELVDGPIVQATLVLLVGYALAHEIEKYRVRAIEAEMPDFLSRMASINEAGVTIVRSLERLSDAELGPLGDEIDRVWRDLQWGATVEEALTRLEARTRTPAVSRAGTLIKNAMAASGDISPVLHIAADEAQETRRLRRERRQEMLTYLVVIYVSFFVFLGIVVALTVSFIPAIESASQSGSPVSDVGGIDTGVLGGLQTVNTDAYELLFFHAAAIQGLCSGIVAGQLGEGSVADGVKHGAVLLGLAYAVFTVL